MVIPEARSRLRVALADLIAGRITNWESDKFYFELNDSPDRAVAEMANFGWSLYHDGIGPYRVTEHYVIKPDVHEIAERCLLFLETELEYEWPDPPSQFWRSLAEGVAIFRILPWGIVLSLVALLLLVFALRDGKDFIYFWICGVCAFLLLTSCIWLWRWSNRRDSPAWQQYWSSGDQEVWPFLKRSEFDEALRTFGSRYSVLEPPC